MKHLLHIIIILSAMLNEAYAEGIFHVSKGMLKEKVTGIVQDERGFLWLSTWGGLYRYDGDTFRSFKTRPGDGTTMPYDRLDAVKLDKNGNLWCRSFCHPYCFDVRTSTFIDVTEKLEKSMGRTFDVRHIFPMAGGYVWLQTDNNEAIRVSTDNPESSARLYSAANGRLKHGKILSINEDSRGMAWILSEGGITVPGSRVAFPQKRFDYWQETKQGCVFLATANGELWQLDTRSWKMKRQKLPIPSKKILRLSGSKDGELVVATDEALLLLNKGKWTVHPYDGTIAKVLRLYRDSQGRYWMITNLPGVMMLSTVNSKLTTVNLPAEGNYENKHDSWFFSEHSDGTMVLMAQGGGLCYYDAETRQLKHVNVNGNFYQPQVGRTFVDSENNVWIYNSRDGLERLSRQKQPVTFSETGSAVYALHRDSKGRLWQGTADGWLTVSGGQRMNLGIVYAIEETADGTMWIGTKDKGLYRLTPTSAGGFTMQQFLHDPKDKYSISANDVYSMAQDGKGNLWVGTYSGGLNFINGNGNGKFINKNNKLTWLPTDERSLSIRSLLYTREGIMCVGTSKGIYAFKTQEKVFHNVRRPDDVHSLSNNEVMMMYQDARGMVYCLTPTSGICSTKATSLLTENASFTLYDTHATAPSDAPQSITEDARGNLWIAYPSSVAMLDSSRKTFYTWGSSVAMTFADIVGDGNGGLIAGTQNGTATWRPSLMSLDASTPRIGIAALSVSNQPASFDADLMDTIRFGSNERDVHLRLSTLTMRGGEKIKYAYRTDGDTTWIMQGDNPTLAFLNLSAGYHTIYVRSTNASGVWCDNVRPITLYVTPTFWETPWAVLLYIIIGMTVIGTIAAIWAYIYRLRLIMRTQEETIKQRMNFIHNVAPLIRNDKDDLLERVRSYIDEHIADEDLTIPALASAMGMSRATFFTRFKELTSLSPQDYLIHYRIAHARRLLEGTALGVAEVAYRCGFSDPKYFSRVFKKIEGMSPSFLKKS
ncbi:MAG: helix-turn-helix domain-containing protein [Prevotella sp.]|nr:helix-turn-helix domain-containing protein [Prevotella sp.]